MEITLILNTKKIAMDLQNRFGGIYPLDMPFENDTVGDYLIRKYQPQDFIYIINETGNPSSRKYEAEAKVKEIELSHENSQTLLQVIWHSLRQILAEQKQDFNLTINFSDTDIKDLKLADHKDYLVTGQRERKVPFTSVTREKAGLKFVDRDTSDACEKTDELVAGVFGFSTAQGFWESCQKIINQSTLDQVRFLPDGGNSFYEAIAEYDQTVKTIALIHGEQWLDLGHEDEYLETKKIVQARFFNSISIDDQRGILTKKSENKDKFVGEVEWYIKMPKQLQYFIPRIYDYNLQLDIPYVAMEYYPYETLHNLYIYGNLDLYEWKKNIAKLLFVRQEMTNFELQESQTLTENDLKDIYLTKTVERVEKLMEDPEFEVFYKNGAVINGQEYLSVSEMLTELPDVLIKEGVLQEKTVRLIHGDLCLSNILMDVDSKLIKLIDPRGKFGSYDIYGDESYDLAKVMHSFEGSYDHIITDNFTIDDIDNTSYNVIIRKTLLQEKITELVNDQIAQIANIRKVRLIEGLLFFSMIPLHADFPKRQKVMFAQAMKLLTPYFGGNL